MHTSELVQDFCPAALNHVQQVFQRVLRHKANKKRKRKKTHTHTNNDMRCMLFAKSTTHMACGVGYQIASMCTFGCLSFSASFSGPLKVHWASSSCILCTFGSMCLSWRLDKASHKTKGKEGNKRGKGKERGGVNECFVCGSGTNSGVLLTAPCNVSACCCCFFWGGGMKQLCCASIGVKIIHTVD